MKCFNPSQIDVDKHPGYRAFLGLFLVLLTLVLNACGPTSGGGVSGSASETIPVETGSPFPPFYPTPEPEELEACLDMEGQWDVLGKIGPGCNLPTGDGGKACQDSDECESLCLANTDDVMQEEAGSLVPDPERIKQLNLQGDGVSGACSSWQRNFGCRVVVEEGKYQQICID
jgi:hypothetical protein